MHSFLHDENIALYRKLIAESQNIRHGMKTGMNAD